MSGSVKWCRDLPVCFQDRAVREAGMWDHKKAMGKGEHPKAHTARWTGGFPGHRRLGDWEGLGVEPKKRSGRDSKTGLFERHSRCSGIFSVTYWNLFVIPKLEWAMFFQVYPKNLREKKGQRPRLLCTYLFCSARAEKVTVCVKTWALECQVRNGVLIQLCYYDLKEITSFGFLKVKLW